MGLVMVLILHDAVQDEMVRLTSLLIDKYIYEIEMRISVSVVLLLFG